MINIDNILENNEDFNLVIDNDTLPKDVMLGGPRTALVTIENDDNSKCDMGITLHCYKTDRETAT